MDLVEYYPDGKMKSIKVSVYDALTNLGYNGRQFDSAWNPLDKSFGPHVPKGQIGDFWRDLQEKAGFERQVPKEILPGRKWMSDQDVNI